MVFEWKSHSNNIYKGNCTKQQDLGVSFKNVVFYRKLIEGEDSRLSDMVGHLCLTGGLSITSSGSTRVVSASASGTSGDSTASQPIPKLNIPHSDTSQSTDDKAAEVAVSSPDTQTEGGIVEQATETSERKTLLIR